VNLPLCKTSCLHYNNSDFSGINISAIVCQITYYREHQSSIFDIYKLKNLFLIECMLRLANHGHGGGGSPDE
jgi:hypothetical protein